jgi:CrcB protein
MKTGEGMERLLAVGLGGLIGSVSRYGISGGVHRLVGVGFPYGTLSVNIVGCFLIGALTGLSEARGLFSPDARAFLFIGLLGGFTTFSSFAYETLALARNGQSMRVVVNVLLQVLACLFAVWAGDALSRAVWGAL